MNNKILSKTLSSIGLLLLFAVGANAQKRIYLEAADSFSGEKINVEWRAISGKTNNSYVIKTEDGIQFIDIVGDDEVQLKAINDLYYVEEKKVFAADINDGEEIKIGIEKRPTATLKIVAKSKETDRDEPALYEIFFEGRMVGRGNTTRSSLKYELVVQQSGSYQIITKSPGYSESKTNFEVQIGNPSNLVEMVVYLEKPGNEVAIRFTDEQSGKPVNAAVTIAETSSGKLVYNEPAPNGVVLFTFKNGINYKITGTSKDYREYSKTLEGSQREDLKAVMRPNAFIEFKITDSRTKRPIPASIKLISPSGKSNTYAYKEGEKIRPEETGDYKVEIQSDGYVPSSGTVGVASLYGSSVEPVFSLVEADKQFFINVIDHYSKEPVANADFRVFGPGGEEVPGVKQNENGAYHFITDPEKSYFIESGGKGYQPVTKSLKEDNKRFTLELYWTPEVTHSFKLMEQFTNKPVTNANLKIINGFGEELFVYDTKKDGVFLTRMEEKINVNYSVTAEGYQSDAIPKIISSNAQELYLSPIGNATYNIEVIDDLTKEKLKASIKYFLDKKEIDPVLFDGSDRVEVSYGANRNYTMEVRLKGYTSFTGPVNSQMIKGNSIVVPLSKDAYLVSFKVVGIEDNTALRKIQLRINAKDGERATEKFVAKTGLYEAELAGEDNYTIQVLADGFETYADDFKVAELSASNFVKTITLKKVPEPEKVEPEPIVVVEEPEPEPEPVKIEEKIEEEPVAIVEKPAVKEPVVEKPVPQPVKKPVAAPKEKVAATMPRSASEMQAEFNKAASLGKRYLLEKVFFDQGSSKIRDAEVDELNELARTLKENENFVIEIIGYTDNVGDPRLNLGLSQFRAKAVANYLFFKGADPDRIRSNGFGQEKAVAENDTEENRAKNRRVEMVLIKN
ncbi:OmpA family protein [uncultured Arcticibacterium sp.]|uniref:OmpA family protein n=1 Tax=uncultured Arcticibacterium sp. TaxID=2173042 RepID=UPI0030FA1DC1